MKSTEGTRLALTLGALFAVGCFETDPMVTPVAGTAARCSSYAPATGSMCAGWYCGTTTASIEALASSSAACEGDIARVCDGSTSQTAVRCAQQLKAANPLDSNEQLRPKVQACVGAEAAPWVSAGCLNCYVENELCVQSACLSQCLVGSGGNPNCDSCRRSSGCEQRFYACAGLPSPF